MIAMDNSNEICRCRDPISGLPCEITGPHDRHELSIRTYDGGRAKTRWLSCDKRVRGRPCVLFRLHGGECQP